MAVAQRRASSYVRSENGAEHARLLEVTTTADGVSYQVIAERPGYELDEFTVSDDLSTVAMLWNIHGASELQILELADYTLYEPIPLPAMVASELSISAGGSMIAMTVDMAYSHGRQGIRVNAVAPGHITTPMVLSVSGQGPRTDYMNTLRNEAGLLAAAWNIYGSWVSQYEAMPELDAMGNAVAIEHLALENEGWERDHSVGEPTEPTA